jgi:hypothetical protein
VSQPVYMQLSIVSPIARSVIRCPERTEPVLQGRLVQVVGACAHMTAERQTDARRVLSMQAVLLRDEGVSCQVRCDAELNDHAAACQEMAPCRQKVFCKVPETEGRLKRSEVLGGTWAHL